MTSSRTTASYVAVLLAVSCGGQSSATEPTDALDAMADQGAADVQMVDPGSADVAEEFVTADANDAPEPSDANDAADAAPICTPGQDQTCNDNPILSSLHGHCTDERTCVCKNDAAPNTTSGRCP